MPSLLDPDLTFEEAKRRHIAYIQTTPKTKLSEFLSKNKPLDKNQIDQLKHNLCDDYPCIVPFIPSPQVIEKLIWRATQLRSEEDILNYINPKEKKRILNEQDLEEPICEELNDLRIFPVKIQYPSLENNPNFFEEVGLE